MAIYINVGNATIDSVNIISSENNYSYTLSANKQIVYMTSVMNSTYFWETAIYKTDTVNYTVNYSNGLSITRTANARLLTVGEALQLTQTERKYNDWWWLADYYHYNSINSSNNYWCVDGNGALDYYGDSNSYFARLGFPI